MPVTIVLLVLAAGWAAVMLLVVCACRAARDGDAQLCEPDVPWTAASMSWSRRPACAQRVAPQRARP